MSFNISHKLKYQPPSVWTRLESLPYDELNQYQGFTILDRPATTLIDPFDVRWP